MERLKEFFIASSKKPESMNRSFRHSRHVRAVSRGLAKILGFADEVESFGPFFQRKDTGFQIDLLYKRFDQVDWMPILRSPVVGESPLYISQHMTGKMFDAYPWQNQKAAIVREPT